MGGPREMTFARRSNDETGALTRPDEKREFNADEAIILYRSSLDIGVVRSGRMKFEFRAFTPRGRGYLARDTRELNEIQNPVLWSGAAALTSSGRGQHNQTTPSPFTRAFRVLPSFPMSFRYFSA